MGPIESTRRSCPAGWLALTLPLSLVRDDETGCMLVLCPACGPLSTSIPGCIAQDSRQGSRCIKSNSGPLVRRNHTRNTRALRLAHWRPPAPRSSIKICLGWNSKQARRHPGTQALLARCVRASSLPVLKRDTTNMLARHHPPTISSPPVLTVHFVSKNVPLPASRHHTTFARMFPTPRLPPLVFSRARAALLKHVVGVGPFLHT